MLGWARKRSGGARSLCCSDGLWNGAGLGHLRELRASVSLSGFLATCPCIGRHEARRTLVLPSLFAGLSSFPSPWSSSPRSCSPPFLPSLLSVIILLTHLLVVSRTPVSQAARWVRVASLLPPSLPSPLLSLGALMEKGASCPLGAHHTYPFFDRWIVLLVYRRAAQRRMGVPFCVGRGSSPDFPHWVHALHEYPSACASKHVLEPCR
jgi:hypothetical protein